MNKLSTDITDLTKLDLPELYELIKNLKDYINTLLDVNNKLKEQNYELSKKRDDCLDNMALDILEYFNNYKSIKKTAEKYHMTTEELIHWIPYWDDCSDGLQSARDYKDFINDDDSE
jgi:hypothetical protein